MPFYCYDCPNCESKESHLRTMAERNKLTSCAKCGAVMQRDLYAEQAHMRKGDLPDWVSNNAGVLPPQVGEANRLYADLGVRFDSDGKAHVPGKNRNAFLKRRGLTDVSYQNSRRPQVV